MCKLNFHADISSKFAFKAFGKIIHKYFDLKGNYVCLVDTEVISSDGHNYRMDIAYLRDDDVINNIEFQMTPVDDEKIHIIGEYAKYILINNDKLVDSNKFKDLVMLTHTLLLKPILIYISPEEITKKLNNLKNKINSNVQLDEKEELEFVILAIFAQKGIAEEITEELCYLFDQYRYMMIKLVQK